MVDMFIQQDKVMALWNARVDSDKVFVWTGKGISFMRSNRKLETYGSPTMNTPVDMALMQEKGVNLTNWLEMGWIEDQERKVHPCLRLVRRVDKWALLTSFGRSGQSGISLNENFLPDGSEGEPKVWQQIIYNYFATLEADDSHNKPALVEDESTVGQYLSRSLLTLFLKRLGVGSAEASTSTVGDQLRAAKKTELYRSNAEYSDGAMKAAGLVKGWLPDGDCN